MNISVYGDSIALGVSENAQIEKPWPTLLAQSADVVVSNNSVSGESTESLLKRFASDCALSDDEALLFALGINDTLYLSKDDKHLIEKKQFLKNFTKLIELARKYTSHIIVIGMTNVDQAKTAPLPWLLHAEYRNEFIAAYDLELRRLCHSLGVSHVNVFGIFGENDLADGVHPNNQGHEKLFERIKLALSAQKII